MNVFGPPALRDSESVEAGSCCLLLGRLVAQVDVIAVVAIELALQEQEDATHVRGAGQDERDVDDADDQIALGAEQVDRSGHDADENGEQADEHHERALRIQVAGEEFLDLEADGPQTDHEREAEEERGKQDEEFHVISPIKRYCARLNCRGHQTIWHPENRLEAPTPNVKLQYDHRSGRSGRIWTFNQAGDFKMAEEANRTDRPWGSFFILEDGPTSKVKRLLVKPGERLSLQSHKFRDEHWVVIRGVAQVTLNDNTTEYRYGQHVYVPRGTKHRISNSGNEPVEIIEVQTGESFAEEDITRYNDDYGRAQ